jgi:2-iminobutanoate/2-iminopropanoate deaminase
MQAIQTDDAPKAIGPYSQAIVFKDLLFVSGPIPINPKSASIEATTIEAQTRQAFRNIQEILSAAGSDFKRMLKCTVFLSDLQDFAAFNTVYGDYFGQTPPARTTVQIARLPRDAKLEIDVMALKEE